MILYRKIVGNYDEIIASWKDLWIEFISRKHHKRIRVSKSWKRRKYFYVTSFPMAKEIVDEIVAEMSESFSVSEKEFLEFVFSSDSVPESCKHSIRERINEN